MTHQQIVEALDRLAEAESNARKALYVALEDQRKEALELEAHCARLGHIFMKTSRYRTCAICGGVEYP